MPTRKVALALLTTTAVLASGTAASAQIDPGVHYDPGSPAGKEYAIPLVEGRAEGAGTTDQRAAANTPFGEGVGPRRSAAARQKGGAGRGDQVQGARPGESRAELTARIREAEAPPATAAPTLLLTLAMLTAAGLLALLLRQRAQPSRTGRSA